MMELLAAAVVGWICLNIRETLRDPKTPLAEGVVLDLGLVAVTAVVLSLSASPRILF